MFALSIPAWPITEVLFAIAAICLLSDVFVKTDVLTHVAYVVVTFALARLLPFPVYWQIPSGILIWFGLLAAHFYLWRQYVQRWAHDILAPEKYVSGPRALIGKTGRLESVQGAMMVRIGDELWPCRQTGDNSPGCSVCVLSVDEGTLTVSAVSEG